MVCRTCRSMNYDGIVPAAHPKLTDYLAKIGVEPQMNARGWINWRS